MATKVIVEWAVWVGIWYAGILAISMATSISSTRRTRWLGALLFLISFAVAMIYAYVILQRAR